MHVSGEVSGILSAQPHEDCAPAWRLTQGVRVSRGHQEDRK